MQNIRLQVETVGERLSLSPGTPTTVQNEEIRLEFKIPAVKSVRKLRLEPVDDYLIMDLLKIQIHQDQKTKYAVDCFSTNAAFREDRRLFFATSSPEIIVNTFNTPVQKVVFILRFRAASRDAIHLLLKKYRERLTGQEEMVRNGIADTDSCLAKKRALEQQVQQLKAGLNQATGQAAHLKKAVAAEKSARTMLLRSSSWKMTAPLRKAGMLGRNGLCRMKTGRFRLTGQYSAIERSGLFDRAFYLSGNPDVKALGISPLDHYLLYGAEEGRLPHPLFEPVYYIEKNPAAGASGLNPLAHYIQIGAAQGKDPHPLFDTRYYLARYPGITDDGRNPLAHFIQTGGAAGMSPHPLFDPAYYLSENSELVKNGTNPLVHYILTGAAQGRDPHPLFSTSFYLKRYPDVASAGINPLVHFLRIGAAEKRAPHPLFDPDYYLTRLPTTDAAEANPLIYYLTTDKIPESSPCPLFDPVFYQKQYPDAAASDDKPLVHFIREGAARGYLPDPLFDTVFYFRNNPDVEKSGVNPLVHYIETGAAQGRDPHPLFDSGYYLQQIPRPSRIEEPISLHFRHQGWRNRLSPGPLFDTRFYMKKYPDVLQSGTDPLSHYLDVGIRENRIPNALIEKMPRRPLISLLVGGHEMDEALFKKMLVSVGRQIYGRWELCLVGGTAMKKVAESVFNRYPEIKPSVKFCLTKGKGDLSIYAAAAAMAVGDYLAMMNPDDQLAMEALYEICRVIQAQDVDIIYADTSRIDETGRSAEWRYKPDFSPDLLLSVNYIGHFFVFKKDLVNVSDGLPRHWAGALDYAMLLELTEKAEKIYHIPKVLSHHRRHALSWGGGTATQGRAAVQKQVLADALDRRQVKGAISETSLPAVYRVKRDITGNPRISIIIPFRDRPGYLNTCIRTILDKSSYSNFEIIGINNGSQRSDTADVIDELGHLDPRIRFTDLPIPFNYSRLNNFGVSLSTGDIILLLNNDIEIMRADWLEALIEHAQRACVGAVGGKLYYPDHTIQHAGVIIGVAGFAGHAYRQAPGDSPGYENRLACIQNVSAVSGAMLMVRKKLYIESGGLDEDNLSVSLNDIDFCLQLRQKEFLNIFTPHCEAIHHESVSRGYEETPGKKMRFHKEILFFQHKWNNIIQRGDPYYNPNLLLTDEGALFKQRGSPAENVRRGYNR